MFSSSKDILYLVLAFCILWVSAFLCWLLYYGVRIMKDTSKIVEEFRIRLQNLSELIKTISDKIESIYEMVSSFNGITGFFKKMMHKKTDEWVDEGAEKVHDVAKGAVERAVEGASRKMRGAAKKIRRDEKETDTERDIYN